MRLWIDRVIVWRVVPPGVDRSAIYSSGDLYDDNCIKVSTTKEGCRIRPGISNPRL